MQRVPLSNNRASTYYLFGWNSTDIVAPVGVKAGETSLIGHRGAEHLKHISNGGASRANISCYADASLYSKTAVVEVQDFGFIEDQETSHFLRHISEAVNCTI